MTQDSPIVAPQVFYPYARDEWRTIMQQLAEPFDPKHVKFLVTDFKAAAPGATVDVTAYVDARAVQARLDLVCPGNWAFDFIPLAVDPKGQVLTCKGVLTIAGIPRADFADASNIEPGKGCVSGAEKRAAVQWGIGRYLYTLGDTRAKLGPGKKILPEEYRRLRALLPRPSQGLEALAPSPDDVDGADEDGAAATGGHQQGGNGGNGHQAQAQAQAQRQQVPMATEQQIADIKRGSAAIGAKCPDDDALKGYTKAKAQEVLDALTAAYKKRQAQGQPVAAGK